MIHLAKKANCCKTNHYVLFYKYRMNKKKKWHFFIVNCLALAKDNLVEKLVLIKEYQDRSIISLKFIYNLT